MQEHRQANQCRHNVPDATYCADCPEGYRDRGNGITYAGEGVCVVKTEIGRNATACRNCEQHECQCGPFGDFDPPRGKILSRAESDAMETRVMSIGCTDQDFRWLMDSHESLRNIVAHWVVDPMDFPPVPTAFVACGRGICCMNEGHAGECRQ